MKPDIHIHEMHTFIQLVRNTVHPLVGSNDIYFLPTFTDQIIHLIDQDTLYPAHNG
jgi:hypothetical protein